MANAQKNQPHFESPKATEEVGKGKEKLQFEIVDKDSEDDSMIMGDLIQPCSDKLNIDPSHIALELSDLDRRI